MNKVLVAIFCLNFFCSCSKESNWREFRAEGLPTEGESYSDLIFINDSTGYLAGFELQHSGSLENPTFNNKAVFYKTENRGSNWQQISLGYKGSVEKIIDVEGKVILLLQHPASTNYVLMSSVDGKSWNQVFSYSNEQIVRAIHFQDSTSGKLIIDNRKEQYLLDYNGSKWDSVLTLPKHHYRHTIYDEKVVSLIPESGTANTTGLLVTDIQTHQTKKIFFTQPYFISATTKVGNDMYLAASKGDKGKIIKFSINKVEEIKLGNFGDYMPTQVFAFRNTIIAIANRKQDVAFLGGIHSFLLSEDGGKTWKLEKLISPLSFKPAYLYQDKFFISDAMIGNLQVREK